MTHYSVYNSPYTYMVRQDDDHGSSKDLFAVGDLKLARWFASRLNRWVEMVKIEEDIYIALDARNEDYEPPEKTLADFRHRCLVLLLDRTTEPPEEMFRREFAIFAASVEGNRVWLVCYLLDTARKVKAFDYTPEATWLAYRLNATNGLLRRWYDSASQAIEHKEDPLQALRHIYETEIAPAIQKAPGDEAFTDPGDQ